MFFWVPEEEPVVLGGCLPAPCMNDVSRGVHCLPAEEAPRKRQAGVRRKLYEQMDTREGKQNWWGTGPGREGSPMVVCETRNIYGPRGGSG